MKFVMFTIRDTGSDLDGKKVAVNRDSVYAIYEDVDETVLMLQHGPYNRVPVQEDFATVHSRLNILEG